MECSAAAQVYRQELQRHPRILPLQQLDTGSAVEGGRSIAAVSLLLQPTNERLGLRSPCPFFVLGTPLLLLLSASRRVFMCVCVCGAFGCGSSPVGSGVSAAPSGCLCINPKN